MQWVILWFVTGINLSEKLQSNMHYTQILMYYYNNIKIMKRLISDSGLDFHTHIYLLIKNVSHMSCCVLLGITIKYCKMQMFLLWTGGGNALLEIMENT